MYLHQFLARAGVASRRKSEELVRAGRVQVAAETVTDPAFMVTDENVTVDGRAVVPEEFEYWLLHKPEDVISTAEDTHDRRTVVDLVESSARLYPVGRLDADTTGLIILTNDGDLANALTHPRYEVPKRYRATVEGLIPEEAAEQLRHGVELGDGLTAPAEVLIIRQDSRQSVIELTIREGRNRQVRRMGEAVGHPVIRLARIAFGQIPLGDLAEGEYRPLTKREITALRGAVGSLRKGNLAD